MCAKKTHIWHLKKADYQTGFYGKWYPGLVHFNTNAEDPEFIYKIVNVDGKRIIQISF